MTQDTTTQASPNTIDLETCRLFQDVAERVHRFGFKLRTGKKTFVLWGHHRGPILFERLNEIADYIAIYEKQTAEL